MVFHVFPEEPADGERRIGNYPDEPVPPGGYLVDKEPDNEEHFETIATLEDEIDILQDDLQEAREEIRRLQSHNSRFRAAMDVLQREDPKDVVILMMVVLDDLSRFFGSRECPAVFLDREYCPLPDKAEPCWKEERADKAVECWRLAWNKILNVMRSYDPTADPITTTEAEGGETHE